ncbi:glucose dehydrogenase [FAD, quinone]-like [Copidosoma floridanum]|uniref:glucose dehydrogenase [FAD, quinone]-like n=1 Tax=Copidosoma floridanum TaxID=29053 RepID=UPI0006C9CD3C|nr:glucose dehydrogenase [FAD, quinone]-like [Copidosoma floridanum]
MAQWSLLSTLVIGLILSTPAIGFLPDLVQSFLNLVRFSAGNQKWSREFQQYQERELPDETPVNRQEYDFIVVGAGSAGATIASRMSELKNEQILLLEAGGHETLTMDVPLLALLMQFNKDINWDYRTDPSIKYCRGIENNQCRVAMGRVMGGTSTLNFMIAVRGNKRDYDEWYELTGDENWSWAGMLRSFKKLESFDAYTVEADPEYRNVGGPVRIANPVSLSPLAEAFVQAGAELGLPTNVDYNGPKQTGFAYLQTNQANGERLSSNRAYLHPAKGRPNLHVSMNSRVTRVLIDPTTMTARGVEFTKNGRRHQVLARKEVILSAGAIASPQLLMLSGVGPAEHLRHLGIQVLRDAPVGENLKDHVAYGGLYFLVNESLSVVLPELFLPTNPNVADYLSDRSGQLSTAGGVEALGFVNVDDPTPDNETPNVELLFAALSPLSGHLVSKPFGIKERHLRRFAGDKFYRHAWLTFPLLMKPKSVGRLTLRSRDPLAKPRIFANYFDDPDDVRVAIEGIRLAIRVSRTRAMRRYGSELHNATVPGCEDHEPDSDGYWECALRTFTITFWHHCGTAKMGRENDTSAVVNTRLQVKGIKRLRVADLSIMPNIVTAHTNIPAMAIGEKFADILKADYGYDDQTNLRLNSF